MTRAALVVAAGALAAWAMVGTGFANYDTAYSLLWGADLAHGQLPDYSVPVAPTPHPLATLLGVVLAPLGHGAEDATVVLAFLFLGALAWVVYELGNEFFGVAAGVLAALIIVTREPVLSFGVRAYLDVPYVVLVLGALLAQARGRSPRLVLGLLGLAGLLRPEAWLFAAVYVLWKRDWALIPLAAAAPLIWVAFDWWLAGDPLYSLTGTRDNAEVLQRRTGLDEVPVTVPRRLGEILREPVLIGAAIGGVLALRAKGRPLLLAGAGVVALAAFCVLAAAGLPILGRYLLLPAAVLAIFCGATLTQGRWPAAVTVVALLVFAWPQVQRIDRLHGSIEVQREIRDDLHALAPAVPCTPVGVPNHRAVPLLALWLDERPSQIVSAQRRELAKGSFLAAASPRVERNFILDRNDPGDLSAAPPAGFAEVQRNRSWVLLSSC